MPNLPVRLAAVLLALLAVLGPSSAAWAHPAPFSYLDLELQRDGIDGALTVHVIDAAHELALANPRALLDPAVLEARAPALERLLQPRLGLLNAGPVRWTGAAPLSDRDGLRFTFHVPAPPPGGLRLRPQLFPYDRFHQTFVNVYDDGRLRQQFIFARGARESTYYRGTTAGALAVMRTFIPSGVHHIWIGADHLLFLFGLILLGGGWRRLTLIVTAFTVGHSITLSLAALDVVNLPARLVEPAIALSIIVVGVDNLLQRKGESRDLRAAVAAVFGLVHGFGFANVLKEFGLPQEALGWSLFSFNVGVELGQLAVVLVVASLLAWLRRQRPSAIPRIETIGSIAVIAGGAYWFVERVFLGGSA
jgi:hydrogenase/urease accessory protein HupE